MNISEAHNHLFLLLLAFNPGKTLYNLFRETDLAKKKKRKRINILKRVCISTGPYISIPQNVCSCGLPAREHLHLCVLPPLFMLVSMY